MLDFVSRTLPNADVLKATNEHSSEGTEHGHPGARRASHIVHAWDAAVITLPTKQGWGGHRTQQVLPPCNPLLLCCLQKHCRFVCQPFRCY